MHKLVNWRSQAKQMSEIIWCLSKLDCCRWCQSADYLPFPDLMLSNLAYFFWTNMYFGFGFTTYAFLLCVIGSHIAASRSGETTREDYICFFLVTSNISQFNPTINGRLYRIQLYYETVYLFKDPGILYLQLLVPFALGAGFYREAPCMKVCETGLHCMLHFGQDARELKYSHVAFSSWPRLSWIYLFTLLS